MVVEKLSDSAILTRDTYLKPRFHWPLQKRCVAKTIADRPFVSIEDESICLDFHSVSPSGRSPVKSGALRNDSVMQRSGWSWKHVKRIGFCNAWIIKKDSQWKISLIPSHNSHLDSFTNVNLLRKGKLSLCWSFTKWRESWRISCVFPPSRCRY